MVFLPQAAVDELGLVLRALQGNGIAPTRAGIHRGGWVVQRERLRQLAFIQIPDAHAGAVGLQHGQTACGVDALARMVVGVGGAAAPSATTGQQRSAGHGECAQAQEGVSIHGEFPQS
ncbi:hypothetical protein D3C87_1887070 [compost metagenome]